ncbi:UPF0262 family protein [Pararhizobium mangrovi]|uniref:UPF0262 family protein n=1 Tax=Pararhizobium mangrovi TaxID=2590452 RepID=UPI001F4453F2|nr:UPF0262 family protein [Pararhizobium mangrovi]
MPGGDKTNRLSEVTLDESIAPGTLAVERECAAAISDLVGEGTFEPIGRTGGPFRLNLSMVEGRLAFAVADAKGEALVTHLLAASPLRRVVRDYAAICESHREAVRSASPSGLEAIDMARRGLHNEGSEILVERLKGKIRVDFPTARRLFTLICLLLGRN